MSVSNFTSLILAAGKGSRMQSNKPKVLVPLAGKPLLGHVLENLRSAGSKRFIIVVGYRQEEVRHYVQSLDFPNCEFVIQEEQLGTGHAVLCAKEALVSYQGDLMITSGDVPLLRPQSLQKLTASHQEQANSVTVLSAFLENPSGYGRIIKNHSNRQIEKIIEEKDATPSQKQVREINSGTYLVRCPEIFDYLTQIKPQNAQNEYYLPDIVALALQAGQNAAAIPIQDEEDVRSGLGSPLEALGVNSLEELIALETAIVEAKQEAV